MNRPLNQEELAQKARQLTDQLSSLPSSLELIIYSLREIEHTHLVLKTQMNTITDTYKQTELKIANLRNYYLKVSSRLNDILRLATEIINNKDYNLSQEINTLHNANLEFAKPTPKPFQPIVAQTIASTSKQCGVSNCRCATSNGEMKDNSTQMHKNTH